MNIQEIQEGMNPEDAKKCEQLKRGLNVLECAITTLEDELKAENGTQKQKLALKKELREMKERRQIMIDTLKDMLKREEKSKLLKRRNPNDYDLDTDEEPEWAQHLESDLKGKHLELAKRLGRQRG